MHPLHGAVPLPNVPGQVTHSALVFTELFQNTYEPSCWRTLQYCRTFIALSESLWDNLASPVFDGVGLEGFKSRANALF